jgi:CheY-like chemotaxis protein
LVLCKLFKKLSLNYETASDGQQAIEKVDTTLYDVILMDIQMPVMDGFKAVLAIRNKEAALGRHTPIIAMTAYALKGDKEECINRDFDDYISKPLNLDELINKINTWILK